MLILEASRFFCIALHHLLEHILTINGKYSKIKVDIPSLTNLVRLENLKRKQTGVDTNGL